MDYFAIHKWLKENHGKANKCENELCTSISPKRFEWALLKGKDHQPDRNNYIQLCPSCHRKYDWKQETSIKIGLAKIGNTAYNKGVDSRLIKECKQCNKKYKHYKETSTFCSKKCSSIYREKMKRQ